MDHLEKQALLSSLQADKATDPKKKQALTSLAQQFTDAGRQIAAGTHNALAHPNDKTSQDKFNVHSSCL